MRGDISLHVYLNSFVFLWHLHTPVMRGICIQQLCGPVSPEEAQEMACPEEKTLTCAVATAKMRGIVCKVLGQIISSKPRGLSTNRASLRTGTCSCSHLRFVDVQHSRAARGVKFPLESSGLIAGFVGRTIGRSGFSTMATCHHSKNFCVVGTPPTASSMRIECVLQAGADFCHSAKAHLPAFEASAGEIQGGGREPRNW